MLMQPTSMKMKHLLAQQGRVIFWGLPWYWKTRAPGTQAASFHLCLHDSKGENIQMCFMCSHAYLTVSGLFRCSYGGIVSAERQLFSLGMLTEEVYGYDQRQGSQL